LALIISVIIVSLIPNTRKASLKIFVSLVLIFVLAYGVLSYLPKSNIYERIVDTQFGVRDRLERIERGVKAFKQSPLLGTGMELALDRAPHDSYFLLLQQVGLIGFICFSLPLVYLIWKLLTNSILCKNENEKIIYLSLAATLFSHLVIGSVINFIHWRHLWYLIGLSMAAVHLFAAGDQKLDEETRELGIRLGQ
jgi:O-antigen ligase